MMKQLLLFIMITVLLSLAYPNGVFAAEVSGTLSTGYQQIQNDQESSEQKEIFFTVGNEDKDFTVPAWIKIMLIGGIALEIATLFIVTAVKRRRRAF